MASLETLKGIKFEWELSKKIGEGDAGEIWLATCKTDGRTAVIKRPVQRAFITDVQRQASQIRFEGDVLDALKSLTVAFANCTVRAVALYDRSREEDKNSARTFLVLEKASGFDVETLLKYRQSGLAGEIESGAEREFLEYFCSANTFSRLLALRVTGGLAAFLPQIHQCALSLRGQSYNGLVWNDIKINHLFWDPSQRVLTIIDFGNAQPLASDGISPDRKFSTAVDARQFCDEMQRFLTRTAPDLKTRLFSRQDCGQMSISDLNEVRRAAEREAQSDLAVVESARQREKQLIASGISKANAESLNKARKQIFMCAEMPDYATQQRKAQTAFEEAVRTLNFGLWEESLESGGAPSTFLAEFAAVLRPLSRELNVENREKLKGICQQALEQRWESAFWDLHTISRGDAWNAVREFLRRQVPDLEPQTPYQILLEFSQGLSDERAGKLKDILENWTRQQPDPQNNCFEYPEEIVLKQLFKTDPARWQKLNAALHPAISIARSADDLWKGARIEQARERLKHWLIRDPERRLVLVADSWLRNAAEWQQEKEILQKFNRDDATRLFKMAGNLRTNLGDTTWLTDKHESILKAFSEGKSFDRICKDYPEAERWFPQFVQRKSEPEWDDDLRRECEAFYEKLRRRDTDEAQKILNSSPLKTLPGYQKLLPAFQPPFGKPTLLEKREFHSQDTTAETALKLLLEIATLTRNYSFDLKATLDKWRNLRDQYTDWAVIGGIYSDLSGAFETSGFLQAVQNVQTQKWNIPLEQTADENLTAMIPALVAAQTSWAQFVQATTDKKQKFDAIKTEVEKAKQHWQFWQAATDKAPASHVKNLWHNAKEQQTLNDFFNKLGNMLKTVDQLYNQLSSGKTRNLDKTAENFLNNLGEVEQLLTGAKHTTQTWLAAFRTRKQQALPETHPLHQWYAPRPVKRQDTQRPILWWDPNFGFGMLVMFLIVCCVCPAVLFNRLVATPNPNETAWIAPTLAYSPAPPRPQPTRIPPSETPSPTPTVTPSETASPTPTPSETPTPTPTATLISDRCNQFADWAQQRNWDVYQKNLDEMSEETYTTLAPHCGWDAPTKKQAHLDVELLSILQIIANDDTDSAKKFLDKLTNKRFGIEDFTQDKDAAELSAYIHWLRVSLALCHATPRTQLQAQTLLAYWDNWHKGQYSTIALETKMDKLCGTSFTETLQGWQSIVMKEQKQSLLSLDGWPTYVRDTSANGSQMPGNCAYSGNPGDAHWWFSREKVDCGLPHSIAVLQPTWSEVSALEISLTRIKDSGVPQTLAWNLPRNNFTTTLRFEQSERGEAENWQIEADFTEANTPVVVASDTLPNNLSFSSPAYLNLQVVSVGRMFFWHVSDQPSPNPNQASSPILLPVALVLPPQNSLLELQRVEFSLGGTTEQPVHLFIRRLQILR